jgi:hypothetical protein
VTARDTQARAYSGGALVRCAGPRKRRMSTSTALSNDPEND